MPGRLTLPGSLPIQIPGLHNLLRSSAIPAAEAPTPRRARAAPAVRKRRRAVKAARKANR